MLLYVILYFMLLCIVFYCRLVIFFCFCSICIWTRNGNVVPTHLIGGRGPRIGDIVIFNRKCLVTGRFLAFDKRIDMASSPLDATAEATEKMEDSLIMMEKSVSKVLLVTPRRSMQGTANFDFIDGATRTNYHRSRRVSMKQNKGRLWQLSKTAWIFLALGLAQGEHDCTCMYIYLSRTSSLYADS